MAVETSVEELGRELGDAIADLPEYEAFAEAKAAVEADPDTQEKIREFEQLRSEFAAARQAGEATQADVAELERAQRELHAEPTMAEFVEAKERLQERLEAVNEAISEPLAVDFGGEAGGCCQD
ncbi:MAG: YlbF family regulator [Halobacteriaceae archaeon]